MLAVSRHNTISQRGNAPAPRRFSRNMFRSILKTLAAMAVWSLGHSALATTRSKQLAGRALGEQRRNGLYRLSYNGIAVVSTVLLVIYIHRLPDRRFYNAKGLARVTLRGLQAGFLLTLFAAAAEIGIGPFSGFSELGRYLTGRRTPDAPEAQGPSLGDEGLRTGGPFRFVRHPLNFSATAIVFLVPEMTAVRLTVALVTLLYSLVGSKLEEQRLLERYGEPYARYLSSGVPFFLPSLRPAAPPEIAKPA